MTLNSMSKMSSKCRLGYVSQMHADLMITLEEIKLGKTLCSSQFVKQLINCQYGKAVLDGEGIQCPVIDAEAPGSIMLPDEEDRRRKGTVTRLYQSFLKHGLDLQLNLLLLEVRIPVRSDIYWVRLR